MRALTSMLVLALAAAGCGGPKAEKAKAEPAALARGDSAGMAQAKAFLAKNAKAPGVHVLPSGLQYKIVRSGPATGLKPQLHD